MKRRTSTATAQAPIAALVQSVAKGAATSSAKAGAFSCTKENGCITLKCKSSEIAAYDTADNIISRADIFNSPEGVNYKGVILPAIHQFEKALKNLDFKIVGYSE